MKPVNIFALTRTANSKLTRRLEKQMSERNYFLRVKDWEVEGLKLLSEKLFETTGEYEKLYFYYSFQIPKLGKEFDLLQITEDRVINIELKSGEVSDEKVRNQLRLNRQYLAMLGKTIHSYTFISSENRLVRLTKSGRLVEEQWENLGNDLKEREDCYINDVEALFREDRYLISPLTDPDRFLRRDYFLTSQQRDIRGKILINVAEEQCLFQGFTGLPGTGKTMLLYDIAMQLSKSEKVCVLHFGTFTEELRHLNALLKRIDFCFCRKEDSKQELYQKLSGCAAICVDEGHRMYPKTILWLTEYAGEKHIPVIFSYDLEEAISPLERDLNPASNIEQLPGYVKYRLTNRIRTNSELSSFIQMMMHKSRGCWRKEFRSVSVTYANDRAEAGVFLKDFQENGYVFINSDKAFCKEFERVVMLVGESFYYDEEGYLRAKTESGSESAVRTLFQGLCRAKSALAVVIRNNEAVFEKLLEIMQGKE